MDPITAATHANPYPYYASLRAGAGLAFHPDLGLWVASNAQAVAAVLAHPECRVRPAHEPVPKAIVDGAAGKVFGQLMRMNDGEPQRCPRATIEPGLREVDEVDISRAVAGLFAAIAAPASAAGLAQCAFRLPVSVVAGLLGFSSEKLAEIAHLTADFVACLSPLSDQPQLDAAHKAAERLRVHFDTLLDSTTKSPLLGHILRHVESQGLDRDSLVANLIGLLSQTHEATAGLIGNAVIALLRQPDLLSQLHEAPARVAQVLSEVQRHDPSVQNTRRFIAAPCTIAGVALKPGDTVLVLLASANRDPQLNPDPDTFILERPARRSFTFGAGRHQCPGQAIALSIATAVVAALVQQRPALSAQRLSWTYKPSLNGRIPLFSDLPEVA